jgi:hypothetical protein
MAPAELRPWWPMALARRIDNGSARVLHVPFRREPLCDAVSQFAFNNLPPDGLSHYTRETYQRWGMV